MSGFVVKGWCPDAWRPMMAGDGLLVRVRPPLGRLTAEQAVGLCAGAIRHGNGQIDLTVRANLQIRGVTETGWPMLLAELQALGLVDPDPVSEGRGAMLINPDWREGDDSHAIASELRARLVELPELPGKVGFVVDVGPATVLMPASGDFRVERAADGGLLLRADARARGVTITPATAVDALIRLAHWFVESGGRTAGRMARHEAALPDWAQGDAKPAPFGVPMQPGVHPIGTVYGLPFGRIAAASLAALVRTHGCAVRLTPWRLLVAEGIAPAPAADMLLADSPILHVDACVGAPACPQASVATRELAARLAPLIDGHLHVSGCAKGCARARAADWVLTGREGAFDLARNARAGAAPLHTGLTPERVVALLGAC
ncbi:cobalamin biosynthesis protein CobG [Sphingomonas sanguinis]|jgi:precorrin-3B synthase|uniref:Cobalamin biosynthesis protein CobG n=1 Tax=Sphingomonas sanguinis TaxID=33051 RepID=A0A7Y7QV94_9SPHN|nr:cobalamin biosynthesis protein CobG [Sphingomonas sanguinis]MBZ6382058.1 cobalamin biosynthesis protein CobG [Sphingomonas sanguinis]NNG49136.1 cobalamin biosynthesis protein CobG [Sphingomonas sanguinis]NNG52613.1 cobalamin biosynthesis protein CobG [Sphingomonas sanguinis]NVP31357.1 cobalamin biosynthesis protein CobG [Sphingomonas sanguinis]